MFFEILSAINNPNQQASVGQLEQVTTTVQQLAVSQGVNSQQMQSMMTVLGATLQPLLKQKQTQLGGSALTSMLGTADNADMVTSLIPPQLQQRLAQTVAQKTGMNIGVAQTILPKLLPVIMQLLNMGAPTSSSVENSNSLLDTFLDGKRTNSTDFGNVLKFTNRFLKATAS
ncbi:MAG: DUF937 domain-containing protein [Cyanobacteria bacterium P01_D01_bin.156]